MPRTATPSRACLACRARHLKCDEGRPACGACVRAALVCTYKSEADIFIRDQTSAVRQKAEKREQHRAQSKIWTAAGETSEFGSRTSSLSPTPTSISFALTQSPEDVALAVFFTRHCNVPRDPNAELGLTHLLPLFYAKSPLKSAYTLAASAEALAIVGRWPERVEWKLLSARKYSQAVTLLNIALADPEQYRKDEILATILLLFAYERVNLPHVPGSAIAHLKGALSLIKLRGIESFDKKCSKQLLSVVRSHALSFYLSPIEDLPADECRWVIPLGETPWSVATQLDLIISEIRTVRHLIRRYMAIPSAPEFERITAIQKIIAAALKVDAKLAHWPTLVPEFWLPLPAESIPVSVRAAGMFEDLCSVYPNIWAGNSYNRYRLARIALHTIILSHVYLLPQPMQDPRLTQRSKITIQFETDGICASVPFYMGSRDTSKTTDQPVIDFPRRRSMPMAEETREALVLFGEWFLFWPLSRMLHNLDVVARLPQPFTQNRQIVWIKGQVLRCGRRAATRSSLGGSP